MVKVKEFCCGCTLRVGTLILAWTVIVWNCICFLKGLSEFLIFLRGIRKPSLHLHPFSTYTYIYIMIKATIGIAVSMIAIWAIQKRKSKYLNGLFGYFCYVVGVNVAHILLVIFDPALEHRMNQNPLLEESDFEATDIKIILLTIHLLIAAFASYFALVVKSSRDYALRNEAQYGDMEGPDPTTVGYVNAF